MEIKKLALLATATVLTLGLQAKASDEYFMGGDSTTYECMDSSKIFNLEVIKDKKNVNFYYINGKKVNRSQLKVKVDKETGTADLLFLTKKGKYMNSALCEIAQN